MIKPYIYTALVTFERAQAEISFFPPEIQGGCGFMAIAAHGEEDVFDVLNASLRAEGLRLIDIEQITEVSVENFPEDLDDRLAANVREWEPERQTVWGTVHAYIADGEA